MSDLQKKAEDYAHIVENYKQLSINSTELSRYHSVSEQEFDNVVGKLEDAIQEDIKDIPQILVVFDKITESFKEVNK